MRHNEKSIMKTPGLARRIFRLQFTESDWGFAYFHLNLTTAIKESQMSSTSILASRLKLLIILSGFLDKKRNVQKVLVHLPEHSFNKSQQIFIEPFLCAVCAIVHHCGEVKGCILIEFTPHLGKMK